ncbi:MAG: hypothetical protein JWQ04_2213 [Pedosphaera sp.]|nr:hypothetical protein [Pedosphaera sp.]
MLIRISLIVAIIGGLAVGALNFLKVKENIIATIAQRDQNAKDRDSEMSQKQKAQKDAKETHAALDRTNALLVATTDERDKAVADNADLTKRNVSLTDNLKKTTAERDSAQNDLAAWKELGIPVERIKVTLASLKTVTEERDAIAEEKKILTRKVQQQASQLDFLTGREPEVKLPVGLRGKVLVADPRYEFVVLDIGEKQGVLENGRLLINRKGKLVAKVQIKSVQADRSIANVMPGWNLGEIMEGDEVLY